MTKGGKCDHRRFAETASKKPTTSNSLAKQRTGPFRIIFSHWRGPKRTGSKRDRKRLKDLSASSCSPRYWLALKTRRSWRPWTTWRIVCGVATRGVPLIAASPARGFVHAAHPRTLAT